MSIGTCWVDECGCPPEWLIEPADGGARLLACGDAEDVFQAIAFFVGRRIAQVVVSAWQPAAPTTEGDTDE